MKIKEIKNKTKEELETILNGSREKLRNLRFEFQLKQSKNVREARKTKKLIAQVLTIINNKDNNK
jgi:ribosomal protein L29